MFHPRRSFAVVLAGLAAMSLTAPAHAVSGDHVTDGKFTFNVEWPDGDPFIAKTTFPVVGSAGGATLLVEQGDGASHFAGELYVMANYTSATTDDTGAFFDFFFQVPPTSTDYLVRAYRAGGYDAFSKPANVLSNITAGSFDTGSPWTWLNPTHAEVLGIEAAVDFGHNSFDPLDTVDHLIAEIEFSIHTPPGTPFFGEIPGLYEPVPAFWSVSKGNTGSGDPPISSAIFQLNPDGTTTVTPILDGEGAPIQQQQLGLPEPTTLTLLMLVGTMGVKRKRAGGRKRKA